MGIDQAEFRRVMGHFLSGVTVVTTTWEEQLHGITVSAFASLSLEPMLVLISIDKRAQSHNAIQRAGKFVVNILDESQEALSVRFATRDDDKFAGVDYRLTPQGLPWLEHVLANIECRVTASLPGGDHTIFVGEVVAAAAHDGYPLAYFRGRYRRIAE